MPFKNFLHPVRSIRHYICVRQRIAALAFA